MDDETKIAIEQHMAQMQIIQAETKKARIDGEQALRRLLPIAQGNSGQCRIVAAFLLGLYNGTRFPFNLNDLRGLDYAIFKDAMTVLRMDYQPYEEVHCYFDNGGAIFEKMAADWGFTKVQNA